MKSLRPGAIVAVCLAAAGSASATPGDPPVRGRLVGAGAHRLHIECRGQGSPTAVIETGLGDFSFDWTLVQDRVARSRRVCTYDRAGYAWSEPGPKPRTLDQLNLELHTLLAAAGEHGPFILVGHSFGGGVVRNYALRYPAEVAGLVLAEAVGDTQYIEMGPKAQQLRDFASGRPIPAPRRDLRPADAPTGQGYGAQSAYEEDPALAPLPAEVRRWHRWATLLPALEDAENSQRDWSVEYIARWAKTHMTGRLGDLPLVVLTRKDGGYADGLNLPARELEAARLASQQALAAWSHRGRLMIVPAGHNLHLEAPDVVAEAIESVAKMAGPRASLLTPPLRAPPRLTAGSGCVELTSGMAGRLLRFRATTRRVLRFRDGNRRSRSRHPRTAAPGQFTGSNQPAKPPPGAISIDSDSLPPTSRVESARRSG